MLHRSTAQECYRVELGGRGRTPAGGHLYSGGERRVDWHVLASKTCTACRCCRHRSESPTPPLAAVLQDRERSTIPGARQRSSRPCFRQPTPDRANSVLRRWSAPGVVCPVARFCRSTGLRRRIRQAPEERRASRAGRSWNSLRPPGCVDPRVFELVYVEHVAGQPSNERLSQISPRVIEQW